MDEFNKTLGEITQEVLNDEYPHLKLKIKDILLSQDRFYDWSYEAIQDYLILKAKVDKNGLDYFDIKNRRIQ